MGGVGSREDLERLIAKQAPQRGKHRGVVVDAEHGMPEGIRGPLHFVRHRGISKEKRNADAAGRESAIGEENGG
jgi:hypothetical protein